MKNQESKLLAEKPSSEKFSLAEFIKPAALLEHGKEILPSVVQGANTIWCEGDLFTSHSPIDQSELGHLAFANNETIRTIILNSDKGHHQWKQIPAPQRGLLIKKIGELALTYKKELAHYITMEVGKTQQEALGEVQEWIDMCDFATGLSRQLHGLTIASERPQHSMQERWHPLGTVVVITAFNFPMAVWAWNAMLAIICGNSIIWKPSEQTPMCSLACAKIVNMAAEEIDIQVPDALHSLIFGDKYQAQLLVESKEIPLVSATGSVAMGRDISSKVSQRLARSILELSGNNALIVSDKSDLNLALRAVLFSAIGTSGQRCTSLRRLIIHEDIADNFIHNLISAYQSVKIGDPRVHDIHMGPLISENAFLAMQKAIELSEQQGGRLLFGGERLTVGVPNGGAYVRPAIVEIDAHADIIQQETFAPVLFVIRYQHFPQALAINNDSSLGLSSALFSNDIRECELFLNSSECGIANINIGTSGAEIGGAFGGEKDTGGGRESGSDAWKNYMRRSTNTINYGDDLPLAQGIKF